MPNTVVHMLWISWLVVSFGLVSIKLSSTVKIMLSEPQVVRALHPDSEMAQLSLTIGTKNVSALAFLRPYLSFLELAHRVYTYTSHLSDFGKAAAF